MAQFDRIEKVLKPLKGVWFYCGYDRTEINRRSSQILNHQRFMPNETLVLMRFFGIFCLNPYPGSFREVLEKISKIITGDVTAGTWKLYVQIECQLDYLMILMTYANMRWNMPRWTKIYVIFWDRDWARFSLRSGFFLAKRARWRSRVLDFFPGFTDKGWC